MFIEFINLLQSFKCDFFKSDNVHDENGRPFVRFSLERHGDFSGLKTALKKLYGDAVEFGTGYYRHAPEIVFNTVIINENAFYTE